MVLPRRLPRNIQRQGAKMKYRCKVCGKEHNSAHEAVYMRMRCSCGEKKFELILPAAKQSRTTQERARKQEIVNEEN